MCYAPVQYAKICCEFVSTKFAFHLMPKECPVF